VRVRLTPKASRDRITGLAAEPGGGAALKVTVTAAPEKGKANAALIRLLAREWRMPASSMAVTAGTTDRRKTVTVSGDPNTLLGRLTPRIATLAGPAGTERD